MERPESISRLIAASDQGSESPDIVSDSKMPAESAAIATVENISIKKELAKTTIPLVIVGSIIAAEEIIKSKFVSNHSIEAYAASGVFNNTFYGLTVVADAGMLSTITPHVSAEFTKGNHTEAGQYIKQGWLLSSLLAIPVMIVLYNSELILVPLDYKPELVEIVVPFSKRVCLLIPPLFNIYVDTALMKATKRLKTLIAAYTLTAGTGVALSAILIPKYGLNGLAYAAAIELWGAWISLRLLYAFNGEYRSLKLFDIRTMERKHFYRLLSKGSPLTLVSLSENFRVFLIGKWLDKLGTVPLAINKALEDYLLFINSPSIGIRQGIQVLVSRAHAKGDNLLARRIGNLGILSEVVLDLIPTFAFTTMPLILVKNFISEADLIEYESSIRLIFFTCALNKILDSLKGCTAQGLYALLENNFASLVQILLTFSVTIPLSYLLVFTADLDIVGFYSAYCISNTLMEIPLAYEWYRKTKPIQIHTQNQLIFSDSTSAEPVLRNIAASESPSDVSDTTPMLVSSSVEVIVRTEPLENADDKSQDRSLHLAFDMERNKLKTSKFPIGQSIEPQMTDSSSLSPPIDSAHSRTSLQPASKEIEIDKQNLDVKSIATTIGKRKKGQI